MTDYNGYEFGPESNRLIAKLDFLDGQTDMVHPQVDPKNPYKTPHMGFFDRNVNVQDKEMPYTMYVPDGFSPYSDGIFLFVPGGYTARAYMEEKGWNYIADKKCVTVVAMECPKKNWQEWELSDALAYARAVFVGQSKRDICSINEGGFYALGFEDGAYMAAIFSMLYSSVFAAAAICGKVEIEDELIERIGNLPADGDRTLKKNQIPLSMWMIGDCVQLVPYFCLACDTDKGISTENYVSFRQKQIPYGNIMNEQQVAEVRYSSSQSIAEWGYGKTAEIMVDFIRQFKKQPGIKERHLRYTQTAAQMGLKYCEAEINGVKRCWYVFEPTAYKQGCKGKYPVVFGMHGICTTGESFASHTEWHRVAEARGFLVVYPFGYMQTYGDCMAPTTAWKGYEFTQMENKADDIAFFTYMLQYMKNHYPVDEERIYTTGHSNGSAMTQMLIRKMPEHFAAFGPVGYTDGDLRPETIIPPFEHKKVCPTWLIKGENDIGCGGSLKEGNANVNMLRHLCNLNNVTYEKGKSYTNEPFDNTTFYSDQQIPLVRYTNVLNMPHSINPEIAWMLWDQYFCRFKRVKDGSIEYLG